MTRKKFLPILAAVGLFIGGINSADARSNPYSDTQVVQLTGESKRDYIAEKMDSFFTARYSAAQQKSEYEVPKGWKFKRLDFNGIPVERFTPKKNSADRILLFFHGGGYVGGLNDRYRDWGLYLAEKSGNAALFALDYRIAPENQYPAALDDAVNAYFGMLDAGCDPNKIVLIGDSAGGNLAAVFALYLKDHNLPLPKAMILISPWLSMEDSLPSRIQNRSSDQILGEKNPKMNPEVMNSSYAKDQDLRDPYISPVYGDLSNLPPTLIIAGSDEILLDDTLLFASREQIAGVDVQESIYPGMSHDWTLLIPELQESQEMFREIAAFVDEKLK
ncbi:MAG: alpha/beta hydrolase [Selenomonadaceae bacterium]|nr:alpha/beta hydrolase [Selenomonadaceae bacterium]